MEIKLSCISLWKQFRIIVKKLFYYHQKIGQNWSFYHYLMINGDTLQNLKIVEGKCLHIIWMQYLANMWWEMTNLSYGGCHLPYHQFPMTMDVWKLLGRISCEIKGVKRLTLHIVLLWLGGCDQNRWPEIWSSQSGRCTSFVSAER